MRSQREWYSRSALAMMTRMDNGYGSGKDNDDDDDDEDDGDE